MESKIEDNKDKENFEIKEINEIITNKDITSTTKINSSSIVESIFNFDKTQNRQISYPKINLENFNLIFDAFNKGIIPEYKSKEELFEFINDKINIMKELQTIIQNKCEILDIIIKFFQKNNFCILEFFIDLYFKGLEALHSQNKVYDILDKNLLNNEIICKIIDIINWIISCGFVKKKNYDYIFQKLAALQLSKNLSNFNFYEYLNLLEIFYGKKYDNKYRTQLVAKNYIYFYVKKNSGIVTNIDGNKKYVEMRDGISIILWFYLTDTDIEADNEPILVEMKINDDFLFKIILNNEKDIVIKCQESLLTNKNDNKFNIPSFKWIQLKVQIKVREKQFKLNLYKGDINELKENNISNNKEKNKKYETKIYIIENIPNQNSTIKSLYFFKNFFGLVGTIIFCNKDNTSENAIMCEYGLDHTKIHNFLTETPIFYNYFIFSPIFFINEKNMFIDSTNNITGKISNDMNNNNIEFNGVYQYKNFINNIYYFGGIDNILPLFEIFYKFTYQNNSNEEEIFLQLIYKKLIKILELILINGRNYISILYNNNPSQNNISILSLQLFLELIDERYYQKDDDILNTLLNIGDKIYNNYFNKSIQLDKIHYFFYYILFSPNIIIKFNLIQQEKLWKFFDQTKMFNIKKSDFKKCFMSFEHLCKFFILLSEKYKNKKKEFIFLSDSFMNIIKVIFIDESTKDNERESLLSLCNYDNLNENIIKGIIEIFIFYLDAKDINMKGQNEQNSIKSNAKEENYDIIQRDKLVNKILNPNQNYIELLLKLFSSKSRRIKKEIINFFKILILKYGDIFEKYFMNIENSSKKGTVQNKINKKEFYNFLEENIILNYFFKSINSNSKTKKDKSKSLNNNQNIKMNHNINPLDFEKQLNLENSGNNKTKRKKSYEFKNKLNEFNNNEKFLVKNKERNLSLENKDTNKIRINIGSSTQTKMKQKNSEKKDGDSLEIKDEGFLVYHVNIENDSMSIKGDENLSQIVENIEVNVNICEILFDLLKNYKPWNQNIISGDNPSIQRTNSNRRSFFEKTPKNKNIIKTNSVDEENILNLLVKFLENTKELEVIKKILLLILETQKKSDIFNHLLDCFSYTNTQFLELIEEILITSYLYLHDKEYQNKIIFVHLKSDINNNKKNIEEELFNVIFSKAKILLIDIYIHDNNKNKNKILNNIVNLILLISNNNKDGTLNINPEENHIYKLLLKLYEDLLLVISNIFNQEINLKKNENSKKNIEKTLKSRPSKEIIFDNNSYPLYYSLIKIYFEFIPFLFEYYLLKIFEIFLPENYKKYEMKINAGFPELCDIKNVDNNSLYYTFVQATNDIFDINKIFELKNNSNNNMKNIFDEKKEIYIFNQDFMSKIFNEYLSNKDYKNEIKFRIELLLIIKNFDNNENNNKSKDSEIQKSNFFMIVEILTLLNNYFLEKYLNNDNNDSDNFNLIFFLNYHQSFIMNIILSSCKIKENETYSSLNKSYKEIQELFYTSLEYNINNIIKNCNSKKYSEYFMTIFINIFYLISKIYELYGEKGGKINFNKTCIKKLVEVYSSKYNRLFNANNLIKCSKNTFEENRKLLEEHIQKNMIEEILKRNPNDINKKPIIDIFNLNKFLDIYNVRMNEIDNIKLLVNSNEVPGPSDYDNYRKLNNKIKNIIAPYENKNVILNESLMNIKKRNYYRKLKKRLYSWNNSYSNLDIFYKSNKEKLKFKISDYLGKDLSRRLLVPILDFDFYVPKFKTFKFEKKLFQNSSKNSEKNQYEELYNIDLKIFNSNPNITLPDIDDPKFIIEEVCYIKTNHHINGVLFMVKNGSNTIFFSSKTPKPKQVLCNNPNFDTENMRCFGSIFSGEFNQKENEIYFNFSFWEINFIFKRKYCFRDNSFEIFTKNHRSYYFKLENYQKRNQFLENIINKSSKAQNNRVIFKPIKGIDENNKSIIIGYYRESEENKAFSNISNIIELWKNNKISTFEYLMWINIYGNRSYNDVAQYPIFPWLLLNHEDEKFDTLISNSNNIRDFHLPLGLMDFNEKGKSRHEGYIETYKLMIYELLNQNLIKIKIKDEDCPEESNSNEKSNQNLENNKSNDKNKNNIIDNKLKNKSYKNKEFSSLVYIKYQNIIPNCEKVFDEKHQKIFDYNLNLDKLYFNSNIPYEMLPYLFGSNFNNAMYISHYLCRLFPYAFTAIEIQGIGFDCADRLFIHLQNSITSSLTEKGDLREIIPDFFTLPELFINMNRLNLGKKNEILVEDVAMPSWCLDNPYYFVENYRSLLESGYLNINSWVDLVFGYYQRGKAAQTIGNIFMPFTYDGVINFRIPENEIVEHRENEFQIRFFEMGVLPTKVFEKKIKSSKNKLSEQITIKPLYEIDPNHSLYEVPLGNKYKNVIYFNIKKSLLEEIYIIDKTFFEQKLIIQETKESMPYSIKEIKSKNIFPFFKFIQRNIEYKLIVKQIFQNEIYIITGLFDGKIHFYKNTNNIECRNEDYEYPLDKSEQILDKSLITALAIDKEEKYVIYGTQKGSIVIYSLNYYLYKEKNEKFIHLYNYFQSHPDFSINYICINSDLNLFADCAYDGFVNIYSFPTGKLVRSIYIDPHYKNSMFNLDFVFLSAQPLASVVVYSNEAGNFKSFSINGNELSNHGNNDQNAMGYVANNSNGMISPIIFTDSLFNDYLLYILDNKIIFLNKFPSMEIIAYIKPRIAGDINLTNLCISTDLKYIYIYEEIKNVIYIVHQNGYKSNH